MMRVTTEEFNKAWVAWVKADADYNKAYAHWVKSDWNLGAEAEWHKAEAAWHKALAEWIKVKANYVGAGETFAHQQF